MTRIPCEGQSCNCSRPAKLDDPWPRWLCPKCWAYVEVETIAGICRLRTQLARAAKSQRHGDTIFITKRLSRAWNVAVAQIATVRASRLPAVTYAQINALADKDGLIHLLPKEPAHVDAGE